MCSISSSGVNPIINEMDLTHLAFRWCTMSLESKPTTAAKSLRHVEVACLEIDRFSLSKFLGSLGVNLKRIDIFGVNLNDGHIRKLCAVCPLLEEVEIRGETKLHYSFVYIRSYIFITIFFYFHCRFRCNN